MASDRFDTLFAAHARPVLAYALRRVATPEDAADVVAETFWVAWRRLDDVPDDARPWLFGVARRVLANHRRGTSRRAALAERLRDELRDFEPAVDDTALEVRSALAGLPEADREVLLLAVWEGLTPTEIASVCGIPAGTARQRLHRARGRLRAELNPSVLPVNAGESC